MRTLYLECNMGAAGDMLMAALFELMPDREGALRELNGIGIPGIRYSAVNSVKCGITGTRMSVMFEGAEEEAEFPHDGHSHGDHAHDDHIHTHTEESRIHTEHAHEHHHGGHHHHSMQDIIGIIDSLKLPEKVKSDVVNIYSLIAKAESEVHGTAVSEVHFHELGMMDAVADIAGTALLLDRLGVDKVIASPVCTGFGEVKCTHGTVPVPAPAAALLLQGIPVFAGSCRGEMCTPTGAALLRYYVTEFTQMPVMRTKKIGYGMGKKDFEAANCVRAFLSEDSAADDTVLELSCNLDDMTGEAIAFAQEQLLRAGALDVFTTAIGMKKGRPGVMLSCLCHREEKENLIDTFFRHTTTLGVRETEYRRSVLDRTVERKRTELGEIRIKYSEGRGVSRMKPEYDDLARIARENDMSLQELASVILKDDTCGS